MTAFRSVSGVDPGTEVRFARICPPVCSRTRSYGVGGAGPQRSLSFARLYIIYIMRHWSWCASRRGGLGCPLPLRSSGVGAVRLAILANMRGPSSSESRNAKTKSGQPSRDSTRCEPVCRLVAHPIRLRAANTRLALELGQRLTLTKRRSSGGSCWPHRVQAGLPRPEERELGP